MYRLDIKPMSVNEAWKGRRFKTDKYKKYRRDLLFILPNNINTPKERLMLMIEAGLSNKGADIDNVAKPFIDVLQEKYQFNDNQIYCLAMFKTDVKKGDEFINFKICEYQK